jgi:hypothetical protein
LNKSPPSSELTQRLDVGVIDQREQGVDAIERLKFQHRIGRGSGRIQMNLKSIGRVGAGDGQGIGIAQRAVVAVDVHRLQALEGVEGDAGNAQLSVAGGCGGDEVDVFGCAVNAVVGQVIVAAAESEGHFLDAVGVHGHAFRRSRCCREDHIIVAAGTRFSDTLARPARRC